MGSYSDSKGQRHPQHRIERKIRVAKELKLQKMMFDWGYVFCERCGVNESSGPMDVSHNISVKKAKESGQVEKCWDTNNLEILCRECHQKKDKLNLKFNETSGE